MKKLFITLVALLPTLALASGGSGVHLENANVDLNDKESLIRGLDHFQNSCSGCHSTQYQRYERVATDLGVSFDDMRTKYIHNDAKIGALMENAIPAKDAAKWFGATPPDLTLVARVRGEDWVYSYLKSFYKDETRPFGVNNLVFPSVAMPHVLESLQGTQELKHVEHEDGTVSNQLELVSAGQLTAEEYDQYAKDLTAFLVYSGDPVKLERESLGLWVMGFLFIFFIIAYLLKKEYWRDVH